MTTVIYKFINKQYLISDFSERRGKKIKFVFEEILNGYLLIGDTRYPICEGICVIDTSTLPEGELRIRIYTSGVNRFAEGLIHKDGRFMRIFYGNEYISNLSEQIENLYSKFEAFESRIAGIEEQINMKIKF